MAKLTPEEEYRVLDGYGWGRYQPIFEGSSLAAVRCAWCGNFAPLGVPIAHLDDCNKGGHDFRLPIEIPIRGATKEIMVTITAIRKLNNQEMADLPDDGSEWYNFTEDPKMYYVSFAEAWEVSKRDYELVRDNGRMLCIEYKGKFYVAK